MVIAKSLNGFLLAEAGCFGGRETRAIQNFTTSRFAFVALDKCSYGYYVVMMFEYFNARSGYWTDGLD